MLSKRMSTLLTAVLAGSMLSLTGCGGQSASTEPAKGTSSQPSGSTQAKTINIGLKEDPPSIDPKISSAIVDRIVQNSIFDKLFDLDKDGKIVPMLADSYEISPDGKTYTLKLRKGIKFHDGTDFDANAVKFNIERYKEDTSTRKSELTFVKAVTVVDPNTVKIELTQPFSPFISILTDRSGMMASPEAVKKYGNDFVNHPVGTGPYVFAEHVKGDHISLKKNENYWNGKVKDDLNYKVFTNGTAAVQNLKSGQLDIIDTIPTKEIANLKGDANVSLVTEPGMGFEGFFLNSQSAPLDNKYLRQAVFKAIDRDAFVKAIYDGYAKPAGSPFYPSNFAYGDSDKTSKPNPDEIKDLLQKGGKPDGFTFKLQIGQGPTNSQIGTVIQGMLKPYNINVELEILEFGTLMTNASTGNFQGLQFPWSGRPDPDQSFYAFFVTKEPYNNGRISNSKLDELAKQARIETDQTKRKDLYQQAMDLVHDESSYIYLVHQYNLFGLSKKINGFTYIPDGVMRTATLDKQ